MYCKFVYNPEVNIYDHVHTILTALAIETDEVSTALNGWIAKKKCGEIPIPKQTIPPGTLVTFAFPPQHESLGDVLAGIITCVHKEREKRFSTVRVFIFFWKQWVFTLTDNEFIASKKEVN